MDIGSALRLRSRRRAVSLVAMGLLSLAFAAPAAATVRLGSNNVEASSFIAVGCGTPPCTHAQAALPSATIASPVNGTVIRWRAQVSPTGTPTGFGLRVLRPFGGSTLFVTAGAAETFGSGGVHERTSALPISIGDRIGVNVFGGGFVRRLDNPGAVADFFQPSPPDGAAASPNGSSARELLVNAEVEPTNSFTLGNARRNKKRGTATISVEVPNPGELVLSGKGLRRRSVSIAAPEAVELRVKAKGSKLRRLNDEDKTKVEPTISFTPTAGIASTQSKRFRLRKKG